jgi:DNA-binding response OmpR family regulator
MEKTPRLLYVEDDVLVSLSVIDTLGEAGFEVQHVVTGKEAIAALEASPTGYQALVSDVRLPEVDGWALAHRARELNPALAVIYVSGDSAAEWAANGVPNSLMIQKPFAIAQLVTAVTTLLNQAAAALPVVPR